MTVRTRLIAAVSLALLAGGSARGEAQQDPAERAYKATVRAQIEASGPAIIAGTPSTGWFCVGGNEVRSHELGRIDENTVLEIEFESEGSFDPVAMLIAVQLGEDADSEVSQLEVVLQLVSDDDGGALQPAFETVAPVSGSYVLFVSALSSFDTGCYRYEVTAL